MKFSCVVYRTGLSLAAVLSGDAGWEHGCGKPCIFLPNSRRCWLWGWWSHGVVLVSGILIMTTCIIGFSQFQTPLLSHLTSYRYNPWGQLVKVLVFSVSQKSHLRHIAVKWFAYHCTSISPEPLPCLWKVEVSVFDVSRTTYRGTDECISIFGLQNSHTVLWPCASTGSYFCLCPRGHLHLQMYRVRVW